MRVEAVDEARRAVRRWYLWVLPPVVAVLAWRLPPFNEYQISDLMAVCASSIGATQWLALLAGAVLTVHDRRPATQPELARRLLAKVVVVGAYGLLLALVDLAVGAPLGRLGGGVVMGALTLPLWAVAGVGLGMLLGTWRRLVVVAVGYPVVAVLAYQLLMADADTQTVYFVLLAPVMGSAALISLVAEPALALIALGITAYSAGLALLVGYNVASRRLRLARADQARATGQT
jgi:hypothetical protein